jgi:cell division protein FtsL
MQKLLLITATVLLGFSISTSAQTVNKDSVSLVSKIEDDKSKLTDLQTQLEERLKNKGDAIAKAQRSANANSTAADKLSDDPRSKKLAKKADKSSNVARKDAKAARIETGKVEKLNKNIRSTKKRIDKNEKRLKKYTASTES